MSKYNKKLRTETVDVYDVLLAFDVRCPARQHAIKKLLMPGLRGHKSVVGDLEESVESVYRAIDLEKEKIAIG